MYNTTENHQRLLVIIHFVIKLKDWVTSLEDLDEVSAEAGKKMATNVMINPGRTSNIAAKTGSAVVSREQNAVLSTLPEVMNFKNKMKGCILENLFKWN